MIHRLRIVRDFVVHPEGSLKCLPVPAGTEFESDYIANNGTQFLAYRVTHQGRTCWLQPLIGAVVTVSTRSR